MEKSIGLIMKKTERNISKWIWKRSFEFKYAVSLRFVLKWSLYSRVGLYFVAVSVFFLFQSQDINCVIGKWILIHSLGAVLNKAWWWAQKQRKIKQRDSLRERNNSPLSLGIRVPVEEVRSQFETWHFGEELRWLFTL